MITVQTGTSFIVDSAGDPFSGMVSIQVSETFEYNQTPGNSATRIKVAGGTVVRQAVRVGQLVTPLLLHPTKGQEHDKEVFYIVRLVKNNRVVSQEYWTLDGSIYSSITPVEYTEVPLADPSNKQPYIPPPFGASSSDGSIEYATKVWVEGQGYATEEWVNQQGFITEVGAKYSGPLAVPTIELVGNTLTIGECDVVFYAGADFGNTPQKFTIPQKSFSGIGTTPGEVESSLDWCLIARLSYSNPTVAEWVIDNWLSGGSVSWNMGDRIPCYRLWIDADGSLHTADLDSFGEGLPEKIATRMMETDYYKRANNTGLMLAATTDSDRIVTISSGFVFGGVVRYSLQGFDSKYNGRLIQIIDLGTGNYSQVSVSGYNNTHYQGPNGLVALGNNKYTVNWVYRSIGDAVDAFLFLGNAEYNSLTDAKTAQPPVTPAILSSHCMRVGRIIVKKDSYTDVTVQSEFSTVYESGSTAVSHTDLTNINSAAEYQHMTAAESTIMDNLQGGVRIFDDSWSMVKSEFGGQYESVRIFVDSSGSIYRFFGNTTSIDPKLEISHDGGDTWALSLAPPANLEQIISVTETSLGLIVTYGFNPGDGKYAYSTDKGETWSALQSAYNNCGYCSIKELDGRIYFHCSFSSGISEMAYITSLGGAYIPCTIPVSSTPRSFGFIFKNETEYLIAGSVSPGGVLTPQIWSSPDGISFIYDSVRTSAIIAACPMQSVSYRYEESGKWYLGGLVSSAASARDMFVVEVDSWSPTSCRFISKNPSGRTDKGTNTVARIIKSNFSHRYFIGMNGTAGNAQIVYTDVPISEWSSAPDSAFSVYNEQFSNTTITAITSISEDTTGRLLATTEGTVVGGADMYYSGTANGRMSSIEGYGRIVGDNSCIAMTPEGIKFLSAGRMVPCSIGNFNSLTDLLAYNTAKTAKGTTASVLLSTMAFDVKWIGKRWVSETNGVTLVYNASGVQLDAGTPVYLSGSTLSGGYYYTNIYKAQANAKATCSNLALVVSTVAAGTIGVVSNGGVLSKLNIPQADGSILYLSATTAGVMTSTEPVYPNFSCKMGVVKRSSTTDGEFYINPDTDPSYATSVSTQSGGASYPLIMSEYADNFGSNTTWGTNNFYSNICSVLFVPQNYLTVTGMQMFVRQVGTIYAARMGIYEVSPSSDMLIAQTEGKTSGFVSGVNNFALQTPNSIVLTPGVKYMLTLQISGNGFEVMRRTGLQTNSPNHFAKLQLNFGSNDFITGGLISTLQGSSTTYQPWIGLV